MFPLTQLLLTVWKLYRRWHISAY